MMNSPVIFDPAAVRKHRARAASHIAAHDFLFKEALGRLKERVGDFKRNFAASLTLTGVDEEDFALSPETFDLILAPLSLHWINDLPGALVQINRALKKDGLLLATLPGGQTLKELRESLERAEMEVTGGVSPRVSPFLDPREGTGLLTRAGFSMPVADSDFLTVTYDDPLKLLYDLRGMGEANALLLRQKHFTRRAVITHAMEYYRQHFADGEGRIGATFELVTLTGWKLSS